MSSDITEESRAASTESFVAALTLNAAIFGAEILIFTALRRRFKAIYEPRTFMPVEDKRVGPLSDSLLGWPLAIYRADYKDIQRNNGLDALVYVRFLRMMAKIFFPIWIISWAVLLPVHGVGNTAGLDGLDQFTFGNIRREDKSRYAAHIILAWIFTIWILYTIKYEMRNFIALRQKHLVDPVHSASAQANTVLITGVPRTYLDEAAIAKLFSHLPGGVKKIWLNRDLKELPDIYDRRLKACDKLESAEFALIKTAVKNHAKEVKADAKAARQGAAPDSKTRDEERGHLAAAERYVPRDQRPTHRLPPFKWLPFGLPFMGEKVDTIDWATLEIANTTAELERGRAVLLEDSRIPGLGEETYPPLNSVFVLFNQQIAAHLASQALAHHQPYRMGAKYTEVAPADIIWSNLSLNPYEQKIRQAISYAATAALIIGWAFPVAFVGVVSNVKALCVEVSWLAWICRLPSAVVGIISGILPPVGLAILMMLLPIILRLLARFEGIPRRTGLELSLMTRFFIFQVIHGFLIVTLSSGLTASLPQLIENPTSIPSLLAENLPKASTFFLTYAILQALAGTAGGLLQAVPLVVYYVKLFILGSTPRSIYNLRFKMRDVAWGTLFPATTLLVVIALGYMIISPIINGLACFAFFLFYQVWKYLFLWQLDQPASGDTGGLFFPKALQHIFVGLYVQQVCLAALFFLAKAIPMGALTVVLIIVTAFFQIILNNSYGPLLYSLPLSLAHKSFGMPQSGSGRNSTEIGVDDDGDFGGDSPAPVPKQKDPFDETAKAELVKKREREELAAQQAMNTRKGDIQAVSGAQATQEYGTSVGQEGKQNDGPTDFNHPASVEPQRIIWLPDDPLGIAAAEEETIRAGGVEVSRENAKMNEKGHVDVTGPPPGVDPATVFQ